MWIRRCFGFAALAYAALIGWLSLIPAQGLPLQSLGDKVQHVAGYAVLGLLAGLAIRPVGPKSLTILTAGVAGYGALIECVQPLTGRFFDVLDMVANSVGAVVGVTIATICVRLLTNRHKTISNPSGINIDFPGRPG